MQRYRWGALALSLSLAAGCQSLGPRTINRDRLDYGESIAASWKRQLLLNIVKLRYLDAPVFVDVSQIVSGYSLETGVNVGGSYSPEHLRGDTFLEGGVSGTFTDRPTVTYTPLTGQPFLKGILDPIPPLNLFHLLQSGYDASFLLGLSLDSINGVKNAAFRSARMRQAEPGFLESLELWRMLQDAGAVSLRMQEQADKTRAAYVSFQSENAPAEVLQQIVRLKQLLGLQPELQHFRLAYSPMRGAPDELAVGCRSILQVLSVLSSAVEVPEADVREERTVAAPELRQGQEAVLRIHSGTKEPEDAFVTVRYRSRWFWISDCDWKSKRTLAAIQFLFTLNDSRSTEQLPLLTIPTN